MRHLLLLGIATVLLASLAWQAWQFDQARQHARQTQLEQQINQDALTLEQQYLAHARTLISLLDPQDALLVDIDHARSALTDLPLAQRQTQFQNLVERIRLRILQAPDPANSETLLQEWRRLTDQMNGALHRHRQLLSQRGSVSPQ